MKSMSADCDCQYLSQVPGTRTDLSGNASAAWTSFNRILLSEVQAADESNVSGAASETSVRMAVPGSLTQ